MKHDILFGVVQDIANLYEKDVIYTDIYSGVFARYYDVLKVAEYEYDMYLNEAFACGKKVLELCCGNGRLTSVFAEHGFTVDGVDASKDMLDLLERKRQKLPRSVAKRLHAVQADVFEYCPGEEKYDFIFLPATTICILSEQPELIKQLFLNVSKMLKPHGSFMFDMRVYDQHSDNRYSEVAISTLNIDDRPTMVVMQESMQYDIGRAIANFYLQVDQENGCIKRYISATNKKMVTIQELSEGIENAKLRITQVNKCGFGNSQVVFYTIKKCEED